MYNEYEWIVSIAEKVEQVKGVARWTLGIFDRLKFCSENTRTEICMLFTDGTPLGNGMNRLAKVKLECGESVDIDDVTEPETGRYEMKLFFTCVV